VVLIEVIKRQHGFLPTTMGVLLEVSGPESVSSVAIQVELYDITAVQL
jgi:hypothetical protein